MSDAVVQASRIGSAAAFYVAGACVGALFFGRLTDRFGRKKLFPVTLGLYITGELGDRREGKTLESIARPLSAAKGRVGRRKTGTQTGSGPEPTAAIV